LAERMHAAAWHTRGRVRALDSVTRRIGVVHGFDGRRVPRAGTGSQRRSRGIRTPEDARYDAWQSRNADARVTRPGSCDDVARLQFYFV
jgi:hypothetical protein